MSAPKFQASTNDLASTGSPLVNFQPGLSLMVKVWESVVVIDSATWLIDLPWAS